MRKTWIWLSAAVVVTAAAGLMAFDQYVRLDTTSPATARARSTAHAPSGGVDCREAKCVALTFDAGPSEHSARLLDVLKDENVPATFFLLGKRHIEKYPDLVRRMADEGHEIANHTWDHKRLTDLGADEIREEIERPNKEIAALVGRRPTLMRPPQGRTNDTVHDICRELGMSEVLWSVTAKDYSTDDSTLIEQRVLEQTERDGIILLHDLYDGTVPAVPGIIEGLKKRGYQFVTVPQLLAPGRAEPGEVYR